MRPATALFAPAASINAGAAHRSNVTPGPSAISTGLNEALVASGVIPAINPPGPRYFPAEPAEIIRRLRTEPDTEFRR
jgi:hypothetical protein